jgi:hypothetical protein
VHFVHDAPQASTVSPAHVAPEELAAPLLLAAPELPPLDDELDEVAGSSPTQAARARANENEATRRPEAIPRNDRMRWFYHRSDRSRQ